MAGREHLDALVDSLPEGVLAPAQTYLQAIQTCPPKLPEQGIRKGEVQKGIGAKAARMRARRHCQRVTSNDSLWTN
jgi:hypothetical protein